MKTSRFTEPQIIKIVFEDIGKPEPLRNELSGWGGSEE